MVTDSHGQPLESIYQLGLAPADDGSIAEALASIAGMVEFSTGTEIFAEGELHDRIYFICDGTASLEMATTSGGKQRILTIGAGDLLAWSGLLGDGRMTATATALEPIRAVEFRADQLRSLCESNPELGYLMMSRISKALSRRLLATRLQLLDLYHVEGT